MYLPLWRNIKQRTGNLFADIKYLFDQYKGCSQIG